MIEVSGFMTDPADSNYSPNTNATDNSPLIDLVINATHRYAATKGSPERLDLSWWHFTCIMHPCSPSVAKGQTEEVHGDTLQQHINQKKKDEVQPRCIDLVLQGHLHK